jgi:hypothetical protein
MSSSWTLCATTVNQEQKQQHAKVTVHFWLVAFLLYMEIFCFILS